MKHGVILLPGIITPAKIAYGDLIAALGSKRTVVAKDLAVYNSETPPSGYSLDTETAAVVAAASANGFDRFHLVGYSAGGAISAAFASRHAERLLSLTLMEPAWFGNEGMHSDERAVWAAIGEAMKLPPAQSLAAFVRINLAPGVEPPPSPPGDPPAWMAKRPAGIRSIDTAFAAHALDVEALQRFDGPVLYVLGARSNQALYGSNARRAATVFRDFSLEVFEHRHHFEPPHRVEPERLARLLDSFWDRAETARV